MQHHLRLAMALDRLLERVDDQRRPLGVIHSVADHEARAVVEQDERERVGAMDVAVDEVQMPHVVRAHCLEAIVMRLALDLGRAIPRLLHHAAHRVHARLDPAAAQLVADLARSQTRMLLVLGEDLAVTLLVDLSRTRPAGR